MRAAQLVIFERRVRVELFIDREASGGELRRGGTSDQDSFDHSCFFHVAADVTPYDYLTEPVNDPRFIDVVGGHLKFYPIAGG